MKRVILFSLMMGLCILFVNAQESRYGIVGRVEKMPDPASPPQTDEFNPLTTGVEVPVLPPERNGNIEENPTIISRKIQQRPPERGGLDAIDPLTTGVTITAKPPERGGLDHVDPLTTGVKITAKPPERGGSDLVDPLTTGVKITAKPPERGGSDHVDPLTTGVKITAKPPERGGSDHVDPLTTGVKITAKPPERSSARDINPLTTGVTISVRPPERNTDDFINPIPLGQAGNAFGFAYTRNTFLWADNNLNSVTFIHRMLDSPGTGYLAYDISKDGGQTWANNIQVYDPTMPGAYNGRYPQGAIYNPQGNTNPDNAYFHYFAPTLDGSNTGGAVNWGGYAFGVKSLADGTTPTQTNVTSTPPFYQYLPAAFTVTQTGEAWMVDQSTVGDASGYNYNGELIIGRGIWNEGISDFQYTFELMPLEIDPDDGFNDWKIAFSPDGQIGWIMCLTNLAVNLPYTSYHPVMFRTTDGGDTWEGPIEVQLGGEDGLEPIIQFISDEALTFFFEPDPVPPRDEIDYFIGYEGDLAVDAWGNPHISGTVCIADNAQGLIYPNEEYMAMFHIWSEDMGQTWQAFNLSDLRRWDMDFTDGGGTTISMYNRPQVATTMDGAIVFFSWLDTENPEVENNEQPDIFFREYLPTTGMHGDTSENVTTFSAAMWNAFFGCMSHYVFAEVTGTQYVCTIPFVYEELTNLDPSQPVQFYYIPDFVKTYTITGLDEYNRPTGLTVSQNYPNPAGNQTTIRVQVPYNSRIDLVIHNLAGASVYRESTEAGNADIKEFKVNTSQLSPGIYFYTVSSQYESLTKKMVITQ